MWGGGNEVAKRGGLPDRSQTNRIVNNNEEN
jgi:hypothetical protein